MQSTETDQKTRPDINAVLTECRPLAEVFGNKTAFGRLYLAATALAAERDRADRAEARLAQILEYADSTYTASTVARRIVQMGKATA